MKLLEAIGLIAKGGKSSPLDRGLGEASEHINAAHRFLFGEKYSRKKKIVTAETSTLIDRLELSGDDFTFIGNGSNGTVYGNDKVTFRLESSDHDFIESNSIAIKTIPEGLAAHIIKTGVCNGVKYKLCERLNTKDKSTLEEIIPFLFKARDAGAVYWDATPHNFGYDRNGDIKVLDHEHFQKLGQPKGNFEKSLSDAMEESLIDAMKNHNEIPRYPMLTFDDHNTYVVLPPKNDLLRKTLFDSLNIVGITSDSIEAIDNPSVLRIAKTEVTYGTPPHTEELADYVDKSLKAAMRQQAPSENRIKMDRKPSR